MHLVVGVSFGALALSALVAACGGEGSGGNIPEDGGAGGGTGGVPTAGTGSGTGGRGGTGGDVGSGGTGEQWPECESDLDCTLISTCCTCMVAPAGTPEPGGCTDLCETDMCTAQGFNRDDLACQHGFCGVVGADGTCNSEAVTCASIPPSCPAEHLPSVVDGCWGPCVLQYSCLSTG